MGAIDKMYPHSGRYLDEDSEQRNVIEKITGGFKEINSDHSAIHMGYGYCLHLYHASLAAEAVKTYRFKGPTTLFAHIKSIQVSAMGAPLKVELIRNPTITGAGTEITGSINNLNDNVSNVAQSKVYDGTVTYTGGNVWCSVIVHGDTDGAGVSKSLSSGSFIQSDYLEYITKDGNTDYILKITNLSTTDVAEHIASNMFFYEEPQGKSV